MTWEDCMKTRRSVLKSLVHGCTGLAALAWATKILVV